MGSKEQVAGASGFDRCSSTRSLRRSCGSHEPLRTIPRPHEATLTCPVSMLREQGFGSSRVLEVKGWASQLSEVLVERLVHTEEASAAVGAIFL